MVLIIVITMILIIVLISVLVMVLIMVLILVIMLVTLSSLRRYESLVASWLTINQRKMKSTPATWMRVKLRLRMMPTKQAADEFGDKQGYENGDEETR